MLRLFGGCAARVVSQRLIHISSRLNYAGAVPNKIALNYEHIDLTLFSQVAVGKLIWINLVIQ